MSVINSKSFQKQQNSHSVLTSKQVGTQHQQYVPR
jgi:hypothetical protein